MNLPLTQWSLIAKAGDADSLRGRQALSTLLDRYLPALKTHLILRRGLKPDQAEDMLQEFVATKILEKELLSLASPDKGRFRTLLLTILDRMVIDHTRKRDNQLQGLSVIENAPGPPPKQDSSQPDVFDCAWAQTVLVETLTRLKAELESTDRGSSWQVFYHRLIRPVAGSPQTEFSVLAETCGFSSTKAARNALTTAKRRFHSQLRAVVTEYLRGQNIEREVDELARVLRSPEAWYQPVVNLIQRWEVPNKEMWQAVSGASRRLPKLMQSDSMESLEDALDDMWDAAMRLPVGQLIEQWGRGDGKSKPLAVDDPHAETSVHKALTAMEPDIEVLKILKRAARRRNQLSERRLDRHLGRALYFSSLAAAFVRAEQLITQLGTRELMGGWIHLSQVAWIDRDVRQLLGEAARRMEY